MVLLPAAMCLQGGNVPDMGKYVLHASTVVDSTTGQLHIAHCKHNCHPVVLHALDGC